MPYQPFLPHENLFTFSLLTHYSSLWFGTKDKFQSSKKHLLGIHQVSDILVYFKVTASEAIKSNCQTWHEVISQPFFSNAGPHLSLSAVKCVNAFSGLFWSFWQNIELTFKKTFFCQTAVHSIFETSKCTESANFRLRLSVEH